MRAINKFISCIIAFATLAFWTNCNNESDYLNSKPSQSLSTISNLKDCELLLSNETVFNNRDPALGEIATDDYQVSYDNWISTGTATERNAYVYAKDIYVVGERIIDWNVPYEQIYLANTVLDALPNIQVKAEIRKEYNNVKGAALFYRSWAFYNLLQTFCMPYDSSAGQDQLGIPLRLSSNINIKSKRENQKVCYSQIINDLVSARDLLDDYPRYVTKPSKWAVNAFLARIYLVMGVFDKAYEFSNLALAMRSTLVDFNKLDLTNTYFLCTNTGQYPFVEDIYHSTMIGYGINGYKVGVVDSSFYSTYEFNDLRKIGFFIDYNGGLGYKGSYEFNLFGSFFSGLATDEMLLVRAETNVRLGRVQAGIQDLNQLLVNRYLTGTYVPIEENDPERALAIILLERRKELTRRGLTWTDVRRLNNDSRFARTLVHTLGSDKYELAPNDLKFAFPIPQNEIQSSGIEQNPR